MLPVSTQGAPLAGERLDRRVLKKELPIDAANGTSDRSFCSPCNRTKSPIACGCS
jgi:hypothetical protein